MYDVTVCGPSTHTSRSGSETFLIGPYSASQVSIRKHTSSLKSPSPRFNFDKCDALVKLVLVLHNPANQTLKSMH